MTVVAEVVRSGFVESVHAGVVLAVDAAGTRRVAVGEVDALVFPRSCNKPMQAVALLRLGIVEKFGLEPRHVAIAAASHSGEQAHVDLVRDLLARADVPESALACPHEAPLDVIAAAAILARGAEPGRIHHNCSGKHSAMLAACAAAGWPLEGYRSAEHPLQRHVRSVVEELTGERVSAVGVDGCGAPVFALSLAGVCRGYAAIITAADGSAERAVADAMRAHPDVVGGTGRDVTQLMSAVPGLLAKDGAEGCYAAALPDGAAVALKIADGAARARVPVLVAALRALGVAGLPVSLVTLPVLGGGERVGDVRPAPLG